MDREDAPFMDLNVLYIESSSHSAMYKSCIVASVRPLSLPVTLATLLRICLNDVAANQFRCPTGAYQRRTRTWL